MATDTPHEFCCIILNSANKKKYIYIYIIVYLYSIRLHFQESNTCNESIIFDISALKSLGFNTLFLVCVPTARHTD